MRDPDDEPPAERRTPRPQRADAARNRRRVLEAARRLFDEHGVQAVTMSDVAREAGVAKGTIFHRFGDRQGLTQALVDDAERDLQERILRGPPPLGPGAPPQERLLAFLDALLTLAAEHRDLLLEIDSAGPAARHRTGAYRAWLQHTRSCLQELGTARIRRSSPTPCWPRSRPSCSFTSRRTSAATPPSCGRSSLDLARRVTAP